MESHLHNIKKIHIEPNTLILSTVMKVRNKVNMLVKSAHNMKNSINTNNMIKIKRIFGARWFSGSAFDYRSRGTCSNPTLV